MQREVTVNGSCQIKTIEKETVILMQRVNSGYKCDNVLSQLMDHIAKINVFRTDRKFHPKLSRTVIESMNF